MKQIVKNRLTRAAFVIGALAMLSFAGYAAVDGHLEFTPLLLLGGLITLWSGAFWNRWVDGPFRTDRPLQTVLLREGTLIHVGGLPAKLVRNTLVESASLKPAR